MKRPVLQSAALHICDPGDLVAVVPYLIGFQPAESLVMLCLRRGRLVVTGRVDLPAPSLAGELAATAQRLCTSQSCDAVVLIMFSDDRSYPAPQVLSAVVDSLPEIWVGQALIVSGGTWSALGANADHGEPIDQTSPAVVEAVVHGLQALPSRADMTAMIKTGDDRLAAQCAEISLELIKEGVCTDEVLAEQMSDLVTATLSRGPTDTEACRLAVLGGTEAGQMSVLCRLTTQYAPAMVGLWASVVGRVPQDWAAGPLALLSMSAWVSGDGALQLISAERSVELDPEQPLAADLLTLNEAMVSPINWDPDLFREQQYHRFGEHGHGPR